MNRREFTLAASALPLAGFLGIPSKVAAQSEKEVVIGALYSMSGPSAQVGIDAKHAMELAIEIINNSYDFDLPTARNAGLSNLGNAKVRLVFADHQADPQKGRAEAERLITQEKVAALIGCYQSSVSATVSAVAERYNIPFLCSDSTSPSLQRRGLKYFFRPAAQDEMFSTAMFDFFDFERTRGKRIETIGLFYEDTIYGIDSSSVQRRLAAQRGYSIVRDIKYRTNSPSLTAEVQQLKSADPDVLMPSTYTSDAILLVKTMAELGYRPKNIVAQASGFSEQVTFDTVGERLSGLITRSSFSLDLAVKRPFIRKINEMFKAHSGHDLSDNTSRQFTGPLILADAIDRAGTTEGPKVREALASTDISGEQTIMPWKRVKFDENGQNVDADPVLLQYVEKKFVTIFPRAAAIVDAVWPGNN